jgi:hypothetical protein
MIIGTSPDTYRDYRLTSQTQKETAENTGSVSSEQQKRSQPRLNEEDSHAKPPAVDLVCRRLTVKWDPIFNITHRYFLCRCILRRSTPTWSESEIPLPLPCICPRHNTVGINFRDYGNIDYHEDPYFKQFGGYNAFRAYIYFFQPRIYEALGGEKFLPQHQVEDARIILDTQLREKGEEDFFNNKVWHEYSVEVNSDLEELGLKLPDDKANIVREERMPRKQDIFDYLLREHPDSLKHLLSEIEDILDGKWTGKPHWALEK